MTNEAYLRALKILKFGANTRVVLVISSLLLIDLVILLDISYVRQITGFIFLTFLPGLLILRILKLDKIEQTETIVLSVGLSVSFLMFFGLLLNNSAIYFGYETPLATAPLLILINVLLITLLVIVHTIDTTPVFALPNLNLNTSEKAFFIVPVVFPALSIFGTHLMNIENNNIILIIFLLLIPIYVASVCFFNNKFPKRLYPVVIFLISISLLMMASLRSNHIVGIDTHKEYYYFLTSLDYLHWSASGHYTLNACLSISILPSIYQSILNIPPEFLFKIFYSLLFSIAPLIIYVLSKKYVGDFYGFLTSVYFMSISNFSGTPAQARTNTAILFFALAMMVLFNDKIDLQNKRILFIVFIVSCVVSHYSTTYISFFIMLITFISEEILSKKYAFKKYLSSTNVLLFFVLIVFWYSQVTEAAFDSGVGFIWNTFNSLNGLFVEEMRSSPAHALLGESIWEKGIPHKIEFVFTWLMFSFIGIGVLTLARSYSNTPFPELNFNINSYLTNKFEVSYFIGALICLGLLIATIALPFVSVGYGMDRVFFHATVLLSTFFTIGGITVTTYLHKLTLYIKFKKHIGVEIASHTQTSLIILLVLIMYFLSTAGVTYQSFGVHRSIILNSDGEQYDRIYVHDQESCCAKWLGSNVDENARIYGDQYGDLRLISQGGIRSACYAKSLIEDKEDIEEGYIYIRYTGVVGKKLCDNNFIWHDMTDYLHFFIKYNKIYNNGGSESYYKTRANVRV